MNKPILMNMEQFGQLLESLEVFNLFNRYQSVINTKEGTLSSALARNYLHFLFDLRPENKTCAEFANPKEKLLNFLRLLSARAKMNNVKYEHTDATAERILGFLIHNSIYVQTGDEVVCIRELAENTQNYVSGKFNFLDEEWLNAQYYPSFSDVWAHAISHTNTLSEQQQQQLSQYEAAIAYRFDGYVFNFEEFATILDALIVSGCFTLAGNYGPNLLSEAITARLFHFVSNARFMSFYAAIGINTTQEVNVSLIALISEILHEAKYTHNQSACLLMGFLLYHNIHLVQDLIEHTMWSIYASLLSPFELELNPIESIPMFASYEWQAAQGYPGKADLEQIVFNPQNGMSPVEPQQIQQNCLFSFGSTRQPQSFFPTDEGHASEHRTRFAAWH